MHQNTTKPLASQAVSTRLQINDLCVFIGRFQPFHDAHLKIVEMALQQARFCLILIGSANEPRTHRNPFSYDERVAMMRNSLDEAERARVVFKPLEDVRYNDTQWVRDAQTQVNGVLDDIKGRGSREKLRVSLIGHSKDETSYYLKLFPQWSNINVPSLRGDLSATVIRNMYFSNISSSYVNDLDGHKPGDGPRDRLVPTAVRDFLMTFAKTPDYADIADEYHFIMTYVTSHTPPHVPHPYTYVTTDACVIQSGFILLVRRKGRPGKGLWALPGGHLKQSEWPADGMLRELREETKIKVPTAILRSSIKNERWFADPTRSSRGRTITNAYLIHLPGDLRLPDIKKPKQSALPEIEGSDDAAEAKWWPLADIKRSMMFEDHYDIITYFSSLI